MSVEMPWEIKNFPVGRQDNMVPHVVPKNGGPRIATAEEVQVWAYVQAMQAKIAALESHVQTSAAMKEDGRKKRQTQV